MGHPVETSAKCKMEPTNNTLKHNLHTVVHVKECGREIGPFEAQRVLEDVCEREDKGEANAAAGEEVLQWRVLAGEVGVVDVDEAEDGNAEAGDGAVEDGEVDDGLEGDAGQGPEVAQGRNPRVPRPWAEEHEDLPEGGRFNANCLPLS